MEAGSGTAVADAKIEPCTLTVASGVRVKVSMPLNEKVGSSRTNEFSGPFVEHEFVPVPPVVATVLHAGVTEEDPDPGAKLLPLVP
jgi:hypothetical protein